MAENALIDIITHLLDGSKADYGLSELSVLPVGKLFNGMDLEGCSSSVKIG
jgi:hypothetical protein